MSLTLQKFHQISNSDFDGFALDFSSGANILLSISNQQDCCEHWGCYAYGDVSLLCPNATILIDQCDWDVSESIPSDCQYSKIEEGAVHAIKIAVESTTHETKFVYLILYNIHNGYYCHSGKLNVTGTIADTTLKFFL